MSIEGSHGKPRSTRARLRDVATVAPDADRHRVNHDARGRFAPGNRAGAGQGAKRVIESPEVDLAARLESASQSLPGTLALKRLVANIRALYRTTRRDLVSDSPLVLSAAATYARESVLAGHLFAEAGAVGLTTDRGLRLLEAVQKAEQRAERASLQAFTMAKAIAEQDRKRRKGAIDVHAEAARAFGAPKPTGGRP